MYLVSVSVSCVNVLTGYSWFQSNLEVLLHREFFYETGDEVKPKALLIMLVLCMSRQ